MSDNRAERALANSSEAESTANGPQSSAPPAHRWLPGILMAAAWGANLGALGFFFTWVILDGRVASVLDVFLGVEAREWAATLTSASTLHYVGVRIFGSAALASTFYLFIGLFLGPRKHRSIRSWLALIAIIAAWLALVVSRHDLAWFGQRWRIGHAIAQFEPIAAVLRKDWPISDGATPELGPFTAYPNGRPTVLMPLTTPASRAESAPFSVVERSDPGALRFELAGKDADSWLEWHPAGSVPASFIGGLHTSYELTRSSPLGEGWYLTRYRSSFATDGAATP